MYSERFLDHFQNPRGVGELGPPAVIIEIQNPACGDILRLSIVWREGRVAEARFKVRGCTASIAAGSALTEWLPGRGRDELLALSEEAVAGMAGGLAPASRHAAALCVDAARKAAESVV